MDLYFVWLIKRKKMNMSKESYFPLIVPIITLFVIRYVHIWPIRVKRIEFWNFHIFSFSQPEVVKVHNNLSEHNFITEMVYFYLILAPKHFLFYEKKLICVVRFWDIATLPAPRISIKKCHKTEHHFSSNFFAQNYFSVLEVFRYEEFFEKDNSKHSCFDFFSGFQTSNNKHFCAQIFLKKFFHDFFLIFLHIILDFDNILMKNTCSMAIYSLKVKKMKTT